MTHVTAYTLSQLEDESSADEIDADLESGVMVRVDEAAVERAGIDETDQNENFDNEYDYEQYGFIVDAHEDDFSWYDEEEDESITVEVSDETVYIVGMAPLEAGSHPFTADELTPVDEDAVLGDLDIDPDPDEAEGGSSEEENAYGSTEDVFDVDRTCEQLGFPPINAESEQLAADPSDVPGITRNQLGLSPWPESWRESNKPARLIAMDAWLSMGASFRGCRRSMAGSIKNPNRYCGSFKDSIYGHTYWRSGGD